MYSTILYLIQSFVRETYENTCLTHNIVCCKTIICHQTLVILAIGKQWCKIDNLIPWLREQHSWLMCPAPRSICWWMVCRTCRGPAGSCLFLPPSSNPEPLQGSRTCSSRGYPQATDEGRTRQQGLRQDMTWVMYVSHEIKTKNPQFYFLASWVKIKIILRRIQNVLPL